MKKMTTVSDCENNLMSRWPQIFHEGDVAAGSKDKKKKKKKKPAEEKKVADTKKKPTGALAALKAGRCILFSSSLSI